MPQAAQVTAAEISRLAGVTRATVSNWRRRHPDFPAPSGGTESSPAYDLDAVRAWLSARGQLPESSPADDLRAALRVAAVDATTRCELTLLVAAASRRSDSRLRTLAALPDDQLRLLRRKAVPPGADEPPEPGRPPFHPDQVPVLRALLRCVVEEGPLRALDVLAESDPDDSSAGGNYPTPAPVADLMADLITVSGEAYPGTVLDPACGAGGLLLAAAARGARELVGQDLAPTQAAQAAARLAIPTDATVRVRAGDSLRADAFPALVADAVLCAPPYGQRDWGHDDLAYDPRWVLGLPAKIESELAWLQHCLARLTPGGRAVLLMPPASAERASGRRIRAALVRGGALRAVVALPAGVAQPLHVGLHLWLIQRPPEQAVPPQGVLFVDTAQVDPVGSEEPTGRRPVPDWPALHTLVVQTWREFDLHPEGFEAVPGTARVVSALDLLDETVDLTPARHVRVAVPGRPDELAEAAYALRRRLRRATTGVLALSGGERWPPVGATARSWRTATVADLLRGEALTLLRAPVEVTVEKGDVILPEMLHSGVGTARVADARDVGSLLGRHLYLLRPDPARLDPWFLAGFLAAEDNLHAAASGSTVVRVDPRRLRVPLLPLAEQQRYGQAFRRLTALRAAADIANRLADETARTLAAGLTGGALLPPDSSEGPR
ncbi:N-6 DNA methylase [Micromonospora sp. NBRC 101691]|uniref:N-6 DNA methylase n=1 Tax=Micromonospora sp. NBRC 101691 TaxID=3032198 RepID=UPI0024A03089|nr:N-6 DNA methylase [Micromonospora sp. NBRC 101691]GLY24450.1 type II restriction endonuclease subunit M [Micromonospora sp. NBRC 101691]